MTAAAAGGMLPSAVAARRSADRVAQLRDVAERRAVIEAIDGATAAGEYLADLLDRSKLSGLMRAELEAAGYRVHVMQPPVFKQDSPWVRITW